MFEGLRKKLSDAVKGFIKKEEGKEGQESVETAQADEKGQEVQEIGQENEGAPQAEEGRKIEHEEKEPEESNGEAGETDDKAEEASKAVRSYPEPDNIEAHGAADGRRERPRQTAKERDPAVEKPIVRMEPRRTENDKGHERRPEQPKEPERQKKGNDEIIKLSLKTKIKSAFLGTIRLNEKEVDDFLETLRMSMLESDVSYDTAERFVGDLHDKLLEKQINSRKIREAITESVRGSLFSVLQKGNWIDIYDFVEKRRQSGELPVKILFLGPNGAGKTTTIAKISNHFKEIGIGNVLSASDTFRAAAIEQIEHHAKRIGVPIIKGAYGADPASIAFDTIAYAKAHSIGVVLIDSAGRQETNKSLINEIEKMVRIARPDITIFVGESTSGNRIAEQILEFSKHVRIDGIILTKLDCDAKGGGALSISHTTGIPILFFGIGESYDALMPYSPNYIVDAILPEGG